MKKNIRLTALVLAALMLVSACGKKGYRTDVPVSQLAESVKSGLASGAKLTWLDGETLKSLNLDLSAYDSFAVAALPMGTTIDEFGVIKLKSEAQAKALTADIEAYFGVLREIYKNYQSAETPKLLSASTKSCGLYVMYAILADQEKEAAFSTFEKQLAK